MRCASLQGFQTGGFGSVLIAVYFFLTGCDTGGTTQLSIGESFPLTHIKTLEGENVSLSEYRGQALLINFWATWCEPCRDEMPALQRLAERLAAYPVAVIGISVDEDVNLVREFNLSHRLEFSGFIDAGGREAERVLALGVFPQTFVLDPSGRVVARYVGKQEWGGQEIVSRMVRLSRGGER